MNEFQLQTLLFFLTVLIIAAGCIVVAYVRYAARRYAERAAVVRQNAGPEPILLLAGMNDEIAANLVAANRILEQTRDTVRRSTKG